jgi:hypothetical protein
MSQLNSHAANRRSPACLSIAEDARGRWIVRDRRLQTIGEFANRRDALHFAMFESDPSPQAVIASVAMGK